MSQRILVCGGRDYGLTNDERNHIYGELYNRTIDPNPEMMLPADGTFIIAGDAIGVDTIAIDWAVVNWVPFLEFKADWNKYGRAAGPIRNQQMLDEGKPDLVLAFPGGRGTQDMIDKALKAGIRTIKCLIPGVAAPIPPIADTAP